MMQWVLSIVLGSAGEAMPKQNTPVVVVVGESIAGVRVGMKLAEARGLGVALTPARGERESGQGWEAGPLLVITNASGRVTTVSLDLRRTDGVKIGRDLIPASAKLDEVAALLPDCTLLHGSGGRVLACKNKAGKVTNFYDSYDPSMANSLWVGMP